jgi:hypothetical protein
MPPRPSGATINNPDAEFVEIPCGECAHETRHRVLTEVSDRLDDGDMTLWRQFEVVQCQGCLSVSFCEASQFSEDMDVDENGQEFIPTTRKLFPSRVTVHSGSGLEIRHRGPAIADPPRWSWCGNV